MSSAKIVDNIKTEVQLLLDSSEVEKAFSLLLTVVYLSPQCRLHIQDIFVNTLCIIGQLGEEKNDLDKVFKLYEEGIKHYPDNPIIYSNLGAHLFRLGYIDEARSHFEKSLSIDPTYLPAHSNLHNIYNLLVPRWHYAMLNDSKRNKSFEAATAEAIKDGYDQVLDIGTGTGLLSLYAIEHGAKQVFACDYSKTMINLATQVLQKNKMVHRIKLISKLSNDIKIPEDLPNKVSLIITETVDAGGLGEHILQTVKHALENLLQIATNVPCVKESNSTTDVSSSKESNSTTNDPQDASNNTTGLVIPGRLKLFAQVVECEYIRMKYKFRMDAKRWRKVEPSECTLKKEDCSNLKAKNSDIPRKNTTRCKLSETTRSLRKNNSESDSNVEIKLPNQKETDDLFFENTPVTPNGPTHYEFHARKLSAYDSEDLVHIPHKVLSQPIQVVDVELNSLDDINRVLNGVGEGFSLEFINTGKIELSDL